MKNLIFLFFFFTSFLSASYVGNMAGPDMLKKGIFHHKHLPVQIYTGYLIDYANDKKLFFENKQPSSSDHTTINNFSTICNMSHVSFNIVNRVQFYSLIGQCSANFQWFLNSPSEEFPEGRMFNVETENRFSWAVGTKLILLKWNQTILGFDTSYFYIPKAKRSFFFLNDVPTPFSENQQFLSLKEWQAGLGLATKIANFFTPYIGGKYANTKIKFESSTPPELALLKNRLPIGVFGGVSMSTTTLYLNAEVRLYDEVGYAIQGSAAF